MSKRARIDSATGVYAKPQAWATSLMFPACFGCKIRVYLFAKSWLIYLHLPGSPVRLDIMNYIARIADKQITRYLGLFGAVLVEGPRWSGKTWASRRASKSEFSVADPEGMSATVR